MKSNEIQLNEKLIKGLNRILRMTHNEISEATGIAIATWYRIAKEPERITVQQIIALSNGLKVPLHHFISSDNSSAIGDREYYIMSSGYSKCDYDDKAIMDVIGPGSSITQRESATAIGKHWSRIKTILSGKQRLTVNNLLTFCRKFKLDPFEFLVDPNMGTYISKQNKGKALPPNDMISLRHEIATFKQQNAELKQLLADAILDNYQLQKEIAKFRG